MHNVLMMPTTIEQILKSTPKRIRLKDERGRAMWFPSRKDYLRQLQDNDLVHSEADFVADDQLTKAVYLDWIRRPQVGCIFAQLLARHAHRSRIRTVVARGCFGTGDPKELAIQVNLLVGESADDPSSEALSVLMPQILDLQTLADFAWQLSHQPGWTIEREHTWRRRLVLIGLRAQIGTGVVAETLGLGPFEIFPSTRKCPLTTLEIRTKPKRAKRSQLSNEYLAAHLADIPTTHMLAPKTHRALFKHLTPKLRRRILEGKEDMRAKASVTYTLPIAIWSDLKAKGSLHTQAMD